MDEFDKMLHIHANRLDQYLNRIKVLEDKVANHEKSIKVAQAEIQGIKCKPTKDKHDDPSYPHFHAAIQ